MTENQSNTMTLYILIGAILCAFMLGAWRDHRNHNPKSNPYRREFKRWQARHIVRRMP